MNAKRATERTKDVVKRLLADGWTERPGKGDHRNFNKPDYGVVTLDTGRKEIPVGTLRSIYRAARWEW